jgi:hypothetical protein
MTCQLLNSHGVNDIMQTEMHMAEPLVTEPRSFEVETATETLKKYKSSATDEIPAEIIKARLFGTKKNFHTLEELYYCTYIKSVIKLTTNYSGKSRLPITYKFIRYSFLKVNYTKLWEIIGADFDVTDQLLIRVSSFLKILKKWEYNGTVNQLL